MPLIGEEIERDLHRFLRSLCEELGCSPLAVGGMADHVHVLLSYPATMTVAEIVERLKGGSSRFVNHDLRPGEFFKWQGHYGAFTVSAHETNKVCRYIDNQKQHHASSTLWQSAEATTEEDPHSRPPATPNMPAEAG